MNRTAKLNLFSSLLILTLGCSTPTKDAPKDNKVEPAKNTTPEHKEGDSHKEVPAGNPATPGDHAHESPHGGKVATSGDKHLEFKMNDEGHIDVFVLDGDSKPTSSKGAQGKVKLTLSDGIKEFPLVYDEKGDHLTAKASQIKANKVVALVDLTIDGKPYSARFDYEFAPHSHD